MSNEREELAERISNVCEDVVYVNEIADAILADGYRKTRTITSVRELHALPNDSVIRTDKGFVFEKDGHWWAEPGTRDKSLAADIDLPATVLYEPEATK